MNTKASIQTVLKTGLSLAALLACSSAWAGDRDRLDAIHPAFIPGDESSLASRPSPYRFAANVVAAQAHPQTPLPWLIAETRLHWPAPGGPLPDDFAVTQNSHMLFQPGHFLTEKMPLVPGGNLLYMTAKNAIDKSEPLPRAVISKSLSGAKQPVTVIAAKQEDTMPWRKTARNETVSISSFEILPTKHTSPVPGGPIENPAFTASETRSRDVKREAVAGQSNMLYQAALAATRTPIVVMSEAGSRNFSILAQTEMASASLVSGMQMQSPAPMPAGEAVHFMAADETMHADAARLNALSPSAGPAPITTITSAPLPLLPGVIPGGGPAAIPVAPAFAPPPPVSPEQAAEQGLSSQSREIADRLPPEKSRRVKKAVKLEHTQKNSLDTGDVRQHKGLGITISVRRPRANVNHMLEEAYDALIAGNQQDAIALYQQALSEEPDNKLALFGLATTYHRAGQLQMARPLYGRLLAIDPYNAEGLNNFLVLLADESPIEALEEMKRLQLSHPDFSTLPAQIAVLYEKLGDYDSAIRNMKQAIGLSPENIKYRYDMAAMLDKSGDWDDAADYYQQLLQASDRGEKLPGKAQEIQERLTFIRSNKPSHP